MQRLVPMVQLLIQRPHWPNALIARKVGCDRRRVRRYRRIIAASDLVPDYLYGCDAITLNALFNLRQPPPRKHVMPDFQGLEQRHPGATGLALWRAYLAEQAVSGLPAMSYSQFQRSRRGRQS